LDFGCKDFGLDKAAVKPFQPQGKILSIPTWDQNVSLENPEGKNQGAQPVCPL
jgi:hypothetical protein